MKHAVYVERLGRVGYPAACERQEALAEACANGAAEQLLLLEHDPVLTLGRSAEARHILASAHVLQQAGIAVYRSTRGGDVTYHGPGQLVAYPILDLARRGMGVVDYVYALEETVIRVVSAYGVQGERDAANRGVWVKGRKIAAVGVRVAKRVTRHGVALNVSTDLRAFDYIVPCGLQERGVTSLSRELGRNVASSEVSGIFIRLFSEVFGTEILEHGAG